MDRVENDREEKMSEKREKSRDPASPGSARCQSGLLRQCAATETGSLGQRRGRRGRLRCEISPATFCQHPRLARKEPCPL